MPQTRRFIFSFFIIWLMSIFLVSLMAYQLFPKVIVGKSYLDSLTNWDGGHFLGIAENGYKYSFQYAFFPFYPELINLAANGLRINFIFAALFLNLISLIIGIYFFIKLLHLDFEDDQVQKIILAILVFPTSFFLLVPYSESLFFCLTILTIYFGRKNKYILATLFGILVSATRLVGLVTILALWLEIYQAKSKQKFLTILTPIGFLAYSYYLNLQTGNYLYFLEAEKYWHRNLVFPGVGLYQTFIQLLNQQFVGDIFLLLEFLFVIMSIGLLIYFRNKIRSSYLVFTVCSLLLFLTTDSLVSSLRFLLVIFPIYIILGSLKNNLVQIGYSFVSILLLGIFITLFINGYWAN